MFVSAEKFGYVEPTCVEAYLRSIFCSRVTLSQDWLPTVQLVLQADWQVLLHSPQPVTFLSAGFAIVLIIKSLLFCRDLCTYYNTLFRKLQALFPIFFALFRAKSHFFAYRRKFTPITPPSAPAKNAKTNSASASHEREKFPPIAEKVT